MTSPTSTSQVRIPHKHACSLCARRKVRCDKGDPCANCIKAQAQCLYDAPAPYRPQKRSADEDLLIRLAQYEELMRKHNVDFTPYANTWVPSGLEVKPKESKPTSPAPTPSAVRPSIQQVFLTDNTMPTTERCLWSSLSTELKYPPIQSLRHKDDPLLHPTPSFREILTITEPELHDLHPEPRHLFHLWQVFVERVNPLTKIVHVPTLQQRIIDASCDLANVSKPLTATLFAIYTLAVTSLSSDACQAIFGETRDVLLTRYRVATLRALVAADFLTARDFEVLQAFVLFFLADPESNLTTTLTGAAIRLGEKMGLHRENTSPEISFFEKEMRIRLWSQLHALDSRNRVGPAPAVGMSPPLSEFGNVRLPLNVNDADLDPDMAEAPAEHNGPTEMLCVLLKFQVFDWLRSSPTAAKMFDAVIHGPVKGKRSVELADEVINEIEAIYRERFFRNCDKRIPLHGLACAMGNLAVASMRFKIHHPRSRAAAGGGDVYITREESDILFDSAVTSLKMIDIAMHSKFSQHLFMHLTNTYKYQLDTYIWVISDLRRRYTGDRVALAWKLVESLYNEHPELIGDTENPFFVALGDLILEAWEARKKSLDQDQNAAPMFIQLLCEERQKGRRDSDQIPTVLDTRGFDGFGWTNENELDWEYWNDFLRL